MLDVLLIFWMCVYFGRQNIMQERQIPHWPVLNKTVIRHLPLLLMEMEYIIMTKAIQHQITAFLSIWNSDHFCIWLDKKPKWIFPLFWSISKYYAYLLFNWYDNCKFWEMSKHWRFCALFLVLSLLSFVLLSYLWIWLSMDYLHQPSVVPCSQYPFPP